MTEKVEIIGFIKDKNNIKGELSSKLSGSNIKITSGYYLFRSNARNDSMDDIISCLKNVTTCENMFEYNNIVSAPLFDTSFCTSFSGMFNGDGYLESIPEYDMSNAVTIGNFCNGCYQLKSVPVYNWGKVPGTNWFNVFSGCTALSDESLNNIMKSLSTLPSVPANQKRLSGAGINQTQANRCVELSNWSALESNGWITGY